MPETDKIEFTLRTNFGGGEGIEYRGRPAIKVTAPQIEGRNVQPGLRLRTGCYGVITVIEPTAYRRPGPRGRRGAGTVFIAGREDQRPGHEDGWLVTAIKGIVKHEPDTLYPWVLDQSRLWVDIHGHEHLIAEMPTPYLENVLGWLRRRWADSRVRLSFVQYELAGLHPDELDGYDPSTDVEDLPVYAAAERELASRRPSEPSKRTPADLSVLELRGLLDHAAALGQHTGFGRPSAEIADRVLREEGFDV